jgi:predicted alpha/beta hydrolase family esterase
MVAHWVRWAASSGWASRSLQAVQGALLAAPPDFEQPLPEGYPTLSDLRAGGWLPVPRTRLPFPSIVGASRNDPLARFARVVELAHAWGSRLVDLGPVGHLNPASGYGDWPRADAFIRELAAARIAA